MEDFVFGPGCTDTEKILNQLSHNNLKVAPSLFTLYRLEDAKCKISYASESRRTRARIIFSPM